MEKPSKREHVSLQMLPSIPEDIIIEILLRLEVKPLVRFQSVSKTWYNLIKSTKFIHMHHNLSKVSQLLICTRNYNNNVFSFRSNDKLARVLSPDLKIPGEKDSVVNLVGSCNGIVCYFGQSQEIFLSNPATREFKLLPCTSIHHGKSDQNLAQIGVAFGYDSPNIYDFKVLRVLVVVDKMRYLICGPKRYRAEMFTLSSKTWKEFDWGLDKEIFIFEDCGLFCANSFHFFARFAKADHFNILSCDIHTERFTTIGFPSKGVTGSFMKLLVFKEFLSAVFGKLKSEEDSLGIWIMKDYGAEESWTKLYKIRHPSGSVQHVCFWMDDHALLLVQYNGMSLTCPVNTLSLESIEIDEYTGHYRFVIHKESLISIM